MNEWQGEKKAADGSRKVSYFVSAATLLLVFSVLLVLFSYKELPKFKIFGVNSPGWYAVHLSNDRLYFGHIKSLSGETILLSDVYGIEPLEIMAESKSTSTDFTVQSSGQKLYAPVKLKNAPFMETDGILRLNRASVISWEKLNDDAEIVRAIENMEKND